MSDPITKLSEDRETFMQRIRDALHRSQGDALSSEVPRVDPEVARLADASDDLVGLFTEKAEAVGFTVYRCDTASCLARMRGAIEMLGAKRIAYSASMGIDLGPLASMTTEEGEPVELLQQATFDDLYDCDLGITGVQAALAETGTMVMSSADQQGRGLSLVPADHLAVVKASQILPDMIDYWASIAGKVAKDLPSSIAFITGPSKTADIEGVLITGVHGPSRVVVLVVEDA